MPYSLRVTLSIYIYMIFLAIHFFVMFKSNTLIILSTEIQNGVTQLVYNYLYIDDVELFFFWLNEGLIDKSSGACG